ncbi:peptide chain release factor 2 [Bacilli bacterium PM5-3]|nr:peptide chain release factor 2 [Bacilli bacterium PM5-3]MDH6604273.1 peptide chain release factor 2 [Bacilli bacterium PM5-9]
MDLYEIRQAIDKIENKFKLLISKDELEKIKENVVSIEEMMIDPIFFQDQNKVKKYTTQLSAKKNVLDSYQDIESRLNDIKEYFNILGDDNDLELISEIESETKSLIKKFNELETGILLNEEYDNGDAILDIHCGAGGTESQDWVEMLYKMYLAYAKKKEYKIELLDVSYASDVGIKSVTLKISGMYAYGLLKNEKGVHRLIRISPFDSSAKRHTTFALVSVSPVLDAVESVEINDSDLEIDTYRSSGAGGQSVNTTDSAVRIMHKPTKIVVTCQNQRSQLQNKQEALNVLKSKLLEVELEKRRQEANILKGEAVDVNFGSQIRTYVFHPYQMVKDHRSNFEQSNPDEVLAGNLDEIINSVLRLNKGR